MKSSILGFFLVTLLAISSFAIADPIIQLIWHSTTGSGTPGTNTIEADKNDILELDIIVRDLDGQGIIGALIDLSWNSPGLVATAAQDCPLPPNVAAGTCFDPLTTVSLSSFLGELIGPTFAGPFDAVSDPPLQLPAFYGWTNPMTVGRMTVRVDAGGFYTINTDYPFLGGRYVLNGAEKKYYPEAEASIVPPGCG